MLAGSTGQHPDDWWNFIKDLRYIDGSAGEDTDRPIPDGTFQGFTVFPDTVSHAAIWRQLISHLSKLGIFGSELMAIIYMDDVVLSVDLASKAATMTAEEVQSFRSKMATELHCRFGLVTQVSKSLLGKRKFIQHCFIKIFPPPPLLATHAFNDSGSNTT